MLQALSLPKQQSDLSPSKNPAFGSDGDPTVCEPGHAVTDSLFDSRGILRRLVGDNAAKKLCDGFGSLREMSRASLYDLEQVGLNISEANVLQAAFVLSSQLATEVCAESPLLDKPSKIVDLLREVNRSYSVEHLQVVLLDVKRRLLGVQIVAMGGTESLSICPRDILYPAVNRRAWGLVLVHNHPSGDPTPSRSDIEFTQRLVAAGKTIGIVVIDHLILGHLTESRPRDYVSLREVLGF